MDWLEIVGWAGSALLVWSLLQTRILRLRALNLVGCLVLIFYNYSLGVWPMVGLNVVLAVINLYYLRKLLSTRHDEREYTALLVGPEDPVVEHMLREHAEDVAAFNPRFARGGKELSFVVVRGDELVGVVLVRDAGAGVAQVELDYVTPRFRDFTPGEFVFRRSHLLADNGFRTVISPPGMVNPYYERLGFRREGETYRLDL